MLGQVTGIQDSIGLWMQTFERAGRLESEAGPGCAWGWPITHLYDAAGNPTVLNTPP